VPLESISLTVVCETLSSDAFSAARRSDDTRGTAGALGALGPALFQHGEVAASVESFTEAAALSRELDDARRSAFLLAYLAGAVGIKGDVARREALEPVCYPFANEVGFVMGRRVARLPALRAQEEGEIGS
jgi:hypothetical protein